MKKTKLILGIILFALVMNLSNAEVDDTECDTILAGYSFTGSGYGSCTELGFEGNNYLCKENTNSYFCTGSEQGFSEDNKICFLVCSSGCRDDGTCINGPVHIEKPDELIDIEESVYTDMGNIYLFFDYSTFGLEDYSGFALYDGKDLEIEYNDKKMIINIDSFKEYALSYFDRILVSIEDDSLKISLKQGYNNEILSFKPLDNIPTTIYYGKQNPDEHTEDSIVYVVEHERTGDDSGNYLDAISNKKADLIITNNGIKLKILKQGEVRLSIETILNNKYLEENFREINVINVIDNARGVLEFFSNDLSRLVILRFTDYLISEVADRYFIAQEESTPLVIFNSEDEFRDAFSGEEITECNGSFKCYIRIDADEELCYCSAEYDSEDNLKWAWRTKDNTECTLEGISPEDYQDASQEWPVDCCTQELNCRESVCPVFDKPDYMIASQHECSESWCCDLNDNIICYERDDKLVVRVESYSPYAWVITRLNEEIQDETNPGRGIPQDDQKLMGREDIGDIKRWWWEWEIDKAELEQGQNLIYFFKDADNDILDYDTKNCLRTGFYYEEGVFSSLEKDFDFPEYEYDIEEPEEEQPEEGTLVGYIEGIALGGQVVSETNYPADAMKYSCMNWVKHQVIYTNNDYERAIDRQHLINRTHENGMKVLLSVVGTDHDVMKQDFDTYFDNYAEFVADLAAMGADAIEIWNEPNIDNEWPSGYISAELFSQLLQKSYFRIKSANPDTIVISGAPAPTGFFGSISANGADDNLWIQALEDNGADNYLDCVGVHYNQGATSPSSTTGHPYGDHYSYYFSEMVELYSNTFPGKPLCFTELGYVSKDGYADSLPEGFSWGNHITVDEQANWLKQVVEISSLNDKIDMLIVWNVDFSDFGDDPKGGYAIIRPSGSCPACDELNGICVFEEDQGSSEMSGEDTSTGEEEPVKGDDSLQGPMYLPVELIPDVPDCEPLSGGADCSNRCNYDSRCDPNWDGRKHFNLCAKSEGHCVQCVDYADIGINWKMGCEQGITCHSIFNWCEGTHYHQEYYNGEWITLLGDGCLRDDECEWKFSDGWSRTCDSGRGLCIEHCTGATEGPDEACRIHFGEGWACDHELDMCIKEGNKKMSVTD
ncbi:hypothetical protein JXB41_09095 [Candidatus Woesearchaeota archaeon]|nr:hypothetical protein [Candidatus Woesearchaeota archaeon]